MSSKHNFSILGSWCLDACSAVSLRVDIPNIVISGTPLAVSAEALLIQPFVCEGLSIRIKKA